MYLLCLSANAIVGSIQCVSRELYGWIPIQTKLLYTETTLLF